MTTTDPDPMSDTAVAWWLNPPPDAVGWHHAVRRLAAEVLGWRAADGDIELLRDRLIADGFRPVIGVLSYVPEGQPMRHTWGVWNGLADDDVEPVATGDTIGAALAEAVRVMGMTP